MYQINLCGPIADTLPNGSNIRATRLILLSCLIILYVTYLIISFLLKKSINSLKLQDQAGNIALIAQNERKYKQWQKQYLLMFGDHAVAIGFVLSFSPYLFEVIVSIIFVIIRIVFEVRLHKFDDSLKFIKTGLRILNLTLLVCAMIGLSRMNQKQDGSCVDNTFNLTL